MAVPIGTASACRNGHLYLTVNPVEDRVVFAFHPTLTRMPGRIIYSNQYYDFVATTVGNVKEAKLSHESLQVILFKVGLCNLVHFRAEIDDQDGGNSRPK